MWVLDPANSAELLSELRPHRLRSEAEVIWVGEGWRPLVEECHRSLAARFPDYELLAVKQKWGALAYQAFPRAWVPGATSWTGDEYAVLKTITDAIRTRSESICEWCGAAAALRDGRSYWVTLCPECHQRFPDPPYVVGRLPQKDDS